MAYSPQKSVPSKSLSNHECKYCKNATAAFCCFRCGDFYCSQTCQDLDWEYHRHLCTPKPKLIKATSDDFKDQLQDTLRILGNTCLSLAIQLEKLATSDDCKSIVPTISNVLVENPLNSLNFLKKSDELVIITRFDTPNRAVICPKNCYEAFLGVLKHVDDYGKLAPLLIDLPQRNQYVIVGRSGSYCRAKILFIKNAEQIRVLIIDYGYSTERRLFDLRQISQDIIELPQYVTIVELKNVENYKLNQDILLKLKNFEFKLCRLKSEDFSNKVELIELNTGESINEIIEKNFKGHDIFQTSKERASLSPIKPSVTFKEPIEEIVGNLKQQEPVLVAPFKEITFSSTLRNAEAFIVNTNLIECGYMACVLEQHLDQLTDVQTYLNCMENTVGEPYVPKTNEYVIAKFDGEWLRGKVVEVLTDDQFEICSIDFLNQSTINSQDIRRYPNDLDIDCYTTLCLLSGLPKNISPKTKQFLKDKIHTWDKILIDRIVNVIDDNVALIECKEIIDRLVEKNII